MVRGRTDNSITRHHSRVIFFEGRDTKIPYFLCVYGVKKKLLFFLNFVCNFGHANFVRPPALKLFGGRHCKFKLFFFLGEFVFLKFLYNVIKTIFLYILFILIFIIKIIVSKHYTILFRFENKVKSISHLNGPYFCVFWVV